MADRYSTIFACSAVATSSAGATDEVIISKNFADANGFVPGDSIQAIINGSKRRFEIVGVAIAPEHTYAVPPGALFPDDKRYGVLWMSRDVIGPAYEMAGAFNEALLALAPGIDPEP
ncbi:MAG: putative ABC transport system permease protein [Hyphomicrobiaceae bacterium]